MVTPETVADALAESLETVARQCSDQPRTARDFRVVRDFTASAAAQCERFSAALIREGEGFQPDVYKAFKALARDALPRHTSPREAVIASLKMLNQPSQRQPHLDWLYEFAWRDLDASQRARLASMSISWLARLSSAVGDPDMTLWTGGYRVRWQFPDRGLRLEATIDAVTDNKKLVIVSSSTPSAEAKAAYAAVVFAAAERQIPGAVVLVDPTRSIVRHSSVAQLLDDGLCLASAAAQAVVTGTSGDIDGMSTSPSSFNCPRCPALPECVPGREWLAKPLTVRGGVRVS